ncbi:hypothetical protein [Bacillus wiedmannii]|uniref:hypothetical protein n=1 Tax=Bacillus wiedmannii TaxID=1890302 RepID=UPI0007CB9339|nr:hypothetical protein [Bacillus wiedmannii]OAK35880.1 hypothetical protein A6284_26480 [Bacillus wiedmannii]HDR7640764.1 hypothetical protein [Bacillus wiedmannii]
MKEEIREFVDFLQQSAVENRKKADEAYDNNDLGLAGYHRGQWLANEGTAIALENLLAKYKEEEQ